MSVSLDGGLLDEVRGVAAAAAVRILRVYHTPFEVERKADASPLTEADLASHRTIVEGLRDLTPRIPVLSEESTEVGFATRSGWTRYWLVDPLDGTKDFVNRNGEFTVNIALIEGHAPVLGVVAVPVTGVAYAAACGLGAHRHDADGVTRLGVRAPAARPWRVAASRSHADARTEGFIRNLGPSERISIGSSLKFCLLAEGGVDIYPRFGPTCEWDTAAAPMRGGTGGGTGDRRRARAASLQHRGIAPEPVLPGRSAIGTWTGANFCPTESADPGRRPDEDVHAKLGSEWVFGTENPL